ncbi:MAG TPA: ferrous iron transport protein A [Microbacteriaceae bacterium]|nr:ferrous iron transport protein A [Microbacteriaceae bacterium]
MDFLRVTPIGTRVVVRTRIPAGYTDALGYLRARDETTCFVETRRKGTVRLLFADVVAAKEVPPPPARRQAMRPPA